MDYQALADMVIKGDHKGVAEATAQAIENGTPAKEIIDNGLIPGMDEVGRRWKANEFHMPEVMIAARAMKAGMAQVRPLLAADPSSSRGTIVIGTVQGDLHDIGKNLVAMMFEGAGYQVHDLGTDTSPEQFIQAIEEHKPDIVGMSALITTTMPMMQKTLQAFEEAEIRNRVKVMVGGAPVSESYARQIGADGYAGDGASAVEAVASLIEP